MLSTRQEITEPFSVVGINADVNVCSSRVTITLYPTQVEGTFTLRLTRPDPLQPVVLADQQRRAAGFQVEMNVDALAVGTYQAVEAIWTVNNLEVRQQFTDFPMPFTILGDNWLITCYNRALESDWPDQPVNACTSTTDPCTYTTRTFRRQFLDATILNGSGTTLDGTIIQRDWLCRNAPANCPAYQGLVFRFPSDGAGTCGVVPAVGATVARMCGNPQLERCGGDRVCIRAEPTSGRVYRVEDVGWKDNRQTQLDLFLGEGLQNCPTGWPNPNARVIRLGR